MTQLIDDATDLFDAEPRPRAVAEALYAGIKDLPLTLRTGTPTRAGLPRRRSPVRRSS